MILIFRNICFSPYENRKRRNFCVRYFVIAVPLEFRLDQMNSFELTKFSHRGKFQALSTTQQTGRKLHQSGKNSLIV